MEDNLKGEFIEYLLFIGVISKSSEKTFNGIYDKLSQLNSISYVQLLSQSLTTFLSNLSFEDFYKISFDIVLRYSRNKVKAHLKPLQRAMLLFDNKTHNSMKRRFRLWNALSKPSLSEEAKLFRCENQRNVNQKHAGSFNASVKEGNYCTLNQSELEFNQNTTMNNIIRLMQANRIKNTYKLKKPQENKRRLPPCVPNKEYVSTNKEANEEESSFSITKIMEKCPEMSFNQMPSSFDTYNYDNNTKSNDLDAQTGKMAMNKAPGWKGSSNLIDEFYVDYLKKEKEECNNKCSNEKKALVKSRSVIEKKMNKSRSLDYSAKVNRNVDASALIHH